jgi:hypothetical protein
MKNYRKESADFYFFYLKPRRQKGMTVIKYPLYRFFKRDKDAARYLALKE